MTLAMAYAQGADTALSDILKVPAGNRLVLSVHAKGDQIYQCKLEQGQYAWQLVAPDARLLDDKGEIVGKHFKGPSWQLNSGSLLTGRLLAKQDKAQEGAVAWLLLAVAENNGAGILSGAKFIKRINTQAGLPPEMVCNTNHLGLEKRIPYQADYVFYGD
jgi:hypothetical protein